MLESKRYNKNPKRRDATSEEEIKEMKSSSRVMETYN